MQFLLIHLLEAVVYKSVEKLNQKKPRENVIFFMVTLQYSYFINKSQLHESKINNSLENLIKSKLNKYLKQRLFRLR